MEPGITWYEVLGVLPGAPAGRIRRRYEERVALLRAEMIAGAPSNVLVAVRRAQEFLDGAWEVLGDPAIRERYDEAAGPRRTKWVPVPDIRGLFYDVSLEVTGRLGLRLRSVRLTARPMPVDGFVVDQSPRAPGKVRRGEAVTVHVWHPPARPGAPPGRPGVV